MNGSYSTGCSTGDNEETKFLDLINSVIVQTKKKCTDVNIKAINEMKNCDWVMNLNIEAYLTHCK